MSVGRCTYGKIKLQFFCKHGGRSANDEDRQEDPLNIQRIVTVRSCKISVLLFSN